MPASPLQNGYEVGVDEGWRGTNAYLRYQLRHHFEADLHALYDVEENADGLPYSTTNGLYLPAPKRIITQVQPTPDNLSPRSESTCLFVGPTLPTQEDEGARSLSNGGSFESRVELSFGVALMLSAGGHEPVRDEEEDAQGRAPDQLPPGEVFVGRLLEDEEILSHRAMCYIGALKYMLLARCKHSPVCQDLKIVDDLTVQFSTSVRNAVGQVQQLAINIVYLELRIEQHQYVPNL
jgi:hypothetical protein